MVNQKVQTFFIVVCILYEILFRNIAIYSFTRESVVKLIKGITYIPVSNNADT